LIVKVRRTKASVSCNGIKSSAEAPIDAFKKLV
jgi:hypothetical protein